MHHALRRSRWRQRCVPGGDPSATARWQHDHPTTLSAVTPTFTNGSGGLRRRAVTGTNTTDYLLDGQSVAREIKNGVVNATYLNGPRGPEYKRDQNGAVQWYLYDGLGSVVGLVDESGNVTNSRKYDVYGAPRNAQTGTAHCFVGGLGHTSDAETGLVHMGARYYDPATGRFVSEDPAFHGKNWYAYAENAPVDTVDPTGCYGLKDLISDLGIPTTLTAVAGLIIMTIIKMTKAGKGASAIARFLNALGMGLIKSGSREITEAGVLQAAAIAAEAEDDLFGSISLRSQQLAHGALGVTEIAAGWSLRLGAALVEMTLGSDGLGPLNV